MAHVSSPRSPQRPLLQQRTYRRTRKLGCNYMRVDMGDEKAFVPKLGFIFRSLVVSA